MSEILISFNHTPKIDPAKLHEQKVKREWNLGMFSALLLLQTQKHIHEVLMSQTLGEKSKRGIPFAKLETL
jgi:hypothetical protein